MKTYQKPEIEVIKFTAIENLTDVIEGSMGAGIAPPGGVEDE